MRQAELLTEPAEVADDPTCPLCGGPMETRTGGRGPFWGCLAFGRGEGCRGTRAIDGRRGFVSRPPTARRDQYGNFVPIERPAEREPPPEDKPAAKAGKGRRKKAEPAAEPELQDDGGGLAALRLRVSELVLRARQMEEQQGRIMSLVRDLHTMVTQIRQELVPARGPDPMAPQASVAEEVIGDIPPFGEPPPSDEIPF